MVKSVKNKNQSNKTDNNRIIDKKVSRMRNNFLKSYKLTSLVWLAWFAWHSIHKSMIWFLQIAQLSTRMSHAQSATAFHFFTCIQSRVIFMHCCRKSVLWTGIREVRDNMPNVMVLVLKDSGFPGFKRICYLILFSPFFDTTWGLIFGVLKW